MEPVLVTGATGLIGSNICKVLLERGTPVRALVRPGSEMEPLAALGVELVEGDIQNRADVWRAAEGVAAIVNSAALIGGVEQDRAASYGANYEGSINCYYAGRPLRVVELVTSTFFRHDDTLREDAELADEFADDPYTLSKSAAYLEATRRIDCGDDIVFVMPGGTFGPAPTPKRALGPTFNRVLRAAIRGEVQEYIDYPGPWVRAEDVARCVVAALDLGKRGDLYLAFGQEEAIPVTEFLNRACGIAGVDHRVTPMDIADDADALRRYGETIVSLAHRKWPTPWFDNSATRAVLGYDPVSLTEALEETVTWLRDIGEID
jgi:nucleoside-diphosphate-sugar epimerase